jgi:hypothetical protein
VIEVLRARDETAAPRRDEHHQEPQSLLRIRQVLTHVTTVQDVPAEEP